MGEGGADGKAWTLVRGEAGAAGRAASLDAAAAGDADRSGVAKVSATAAFDGDDDSAAAGARGGFNGCGDEEGAGAVSSAATDDATVRDAARWGGGETLREGAALALAVAVDAPKKDDTGRQPATRVDTHGRSADATPVGLLNADVTGVQERLSNAGRAASATACATGVDGSSHASTSAAVDSTTGDRGWSHSVTLAAVVRRTNECTPASVTS